MPAYGKIALVTPCFHPSDVAFAQGWSKRAPGIDGWRIVLDRQGMTELVSVIPPGSDEPMFFISRPGVRVLVERRARGQGEDTLMPVGEYDNLRQAVQALCPLSDDDMQEIHEELEVAFPRRRR